MIADVKSSPTQSPSKAEASVAFTSSPRERPISSYFGKRVRIEDSDDIEETAALMTKKHHHAIQFVETLTCKGIQIKYPFKPYDSQVQIMTRMTEALEAKQHALLESPTGTGKTMALLSASLAWHEDYMRRFWKRNEKIRGLDADDVKAMVERGEVEDMAIPRIYYASRTHKQISQVVKELRRSAYSNFSFTVLASRTHYCINDRIRREKRDINEACTEAMRSKDPTERCHFINSLESFFKKNPEYVTQKNVEELTKYGRAQAMCPYFLARQSSGRSIIVFCPFDYLVNDTIRDAMEINLKDSVVIVDEGHNIEDVCREAGGFECDDSAFYAVSSELQSFFDKQGNQSGLVALPEAHRSQLHVVTSLLAWMNASHPESGNTKISFDKTIYEWRNESLINELKDIGLTPETVEIWSSQLTLIVAKTRDLDRDSRDRNKTRFLKGEDQDADLQMCMSMGNCRVLARLYFVLKKILARKHLADYRLVLWSQMAPSSSDGKSEPRLVRNVGFWCMNPGVVFETLAQETRCVLLSSGTLAPMDTFSCELGTKFPLITEAMHVIDPQKQLWAGSFARGPSGQIELKGTFGEMDKFVFQDDLGQAIVDICKIVPYGVLCFVPSYGFLDKLIKRMKATKRFEQLSKVKEVYIEPRQVSNDAFEKLLNNYQKTITSLMRTPPSSSSARNGCIFFAVFRGKVSEGLDFVDENARCVISIGIPYPALKDEKIVLKREYNDQNRSASLNGSQWYEKQAFRAINQALGRCIRHKDDWGAIVLLESRFHQSRCTSQLSKWIRPTIRAINDYHIGIADLKAFIQSKYPNGMVPIREAPKLDEPSTVDDDGPLKVLE